MLLTVTYRKTNTFAYTHILDSGFTKVFCGDDAPTTLLETLDDPRNPYVGKNNVSCTGCLAEFSTGRRTGHRNEVETPDPVQDVENAQGTTC